MDGCPDKGVAPAVAVMSLGPDRRGTDASAAGAGKEPREGIPDADWPRKHKRGC